MFGGEEKGVESRGVDFEASWAGRVGQLGVGEGRDEGGEFGVSGNGGEGDWKERTHTEGMTEGGVTIGWVRVGGKEGEVGKGGVKLESMD